MKHKTTKNPKKALTALLHHAIDYAALFPPKKMKIEEALKKYIQLREGPESPLLGRFIVPIAELDPLTNLLANRKPAKKIELLLTLPSSWLYPSVVKKIDDCNTQCQEWAKLSLIEVKFTKTKKIDDYKNLQKLLPTYVEVVQREEIDQIAPHSLGVKIRCGALTKQEYPSSFHIAQLITRTIEHSLPIKFTAGLHHPITHHCKKLGCTIYGFINVIGGALMANEQKINLHELMGMIDDPYSDHFSLSEEGFRWKELFIDLPTIIKARKEFLQGFGSCSFSEPIEDLKKLGWIS